MSDRREEHPENRSDAIDGAAPEDDFDSAWTDEGGASRQGPGTSRRAPGDEQGEAAEDGSPDRVERGEEGEGGDDTPRPGSSAGETQPPITLDPPD